LITIQIQSLFYGFFYTQKVEGNAGMTEDTLAHGLVKALQMDTADSREISCNAICKGE